MVIASTAFHIAQLSWHQVPFSHEMHVAALRGFKQTELHPLMHEAGCLAVWQ
jgi:hypothetical protein